MPCFSVIVTVLIDVSTIEKAAATLGIQVIRRNANRYTLRKDSDVIDIVRAAEGQKFQTVAGSGGGNYPDNILTPLTMAYAKARVKQFAEKNGYTLSAGEKAGQYVLTSYR